MTTPSLPRKECRSPVGRCLLLPIPPPHFLRSPKDWRYAGRTVESLWPDRVVGSFLDDISLFRLFTPTVTDLAGGPSPWFFRPQASHHAIRTSGAHTPSPWRTDCAAVTPISGLRGKDGPSLGLVAVTLNSLLPRQNSRAPIPAPPTAVHCGSWTASGRYVLCYRSHGLMLLK